MNTISSTSIGRTAPAGVLAGKAAVHELAIFGGTPLFPEPLVVGRPNFPDREQLFARLGQAFERRRLSNFGPEVLEFEAAVANVAGVKHCVSMCNGTVALEIVIRALGLTGEVIVPSFTFVATAHALAWLGLTPVFCDINPRDHTIDPAQVESMITPRTSAILAVHLWGQPCDVEALGTVAARHNVRLLFDAAHAFGCSYRGRPIGSFGVAEVFSFHATKFVNTFEGGAVVTNDEGLAARVRAMSNFGFTGQDHVTSVGTNGKMSEVSAAMGLASLARLPEIVSVNQRNYELYRERLELPGVRMLHYDAEPCNFQYVVIEVSPESGFSRDRLLEVLHAEGVLARRYFYPSVHRMEPYRTLQPAASTRLPHTERASERVLVLPTGTDVSSTEIYQICELIKYCLTHGPEISERLPSEKLVVARDLR